MPYLKEKILLVRREMLEGYLKRPLSRLAFDYQMGRLTLQLLISNEDKVQEDF